MHRRNLQPTTVTETRMVQWVAAALLCALPIGCGYQTYEYRLQESVKYNRYQNELNQNLGAPWSAMGMSLRPPLQFRLLPPPEKDEEGNEPSVDPRQPDYLNAKLPGLVAAWQGHVSPAGGGQNKVPCYMYVLSNHELWLDQRPDASVLALAFKDEVPETIARGMGMPAPGKERWTTESHPDRSGYAEKKRYDVVTLIPDRPLRGLEGNYEVAIYLHDVQDIRVAFVFVTPQDVDRRENLKKRIELCLETVSVSGEKPKPGGRDVPASKSRIDL